MEKEEYSVLGLMSGTSLDGLDMALCRFFKDNSKWRFEILKANTVEYPDSWLTKLRYAPYHAGDELIRLHHEYGKYLGNKINAFLKKVKVKPDFVSSHGHTIYHTPAKGLTFQLGHGAFVAATCKLPVICDFRTLDVALGGQGAPLVPVGDHMLFPEYRFCLNLGGFSNISFDLNGTRTAFDICPVNIILNYFANHLKHQSFDKDGELGRKGRIIKNLLQKLNDLPYYHSSFPKSLSREWLENEFATALNNERGVSYDILRTLYEHIAEQIAKTINEFGSSDEDTILITGGGAHNLFLIELLKAKCKYEIIIPDRLIIDYKEALVFAFLGLLRWLNKTNCLSSVTGASSDSSSGCIYYF